MLVRLAYLGQWTSCMELFGHSQSWLSTVFNDVVQFLYCCFKDILKWHPLLTYSWLQGLASAIEAQGGGERIWGFVDGTFQGFAIHKTMTDSVLSILVML